MDRRLYEASLSGSVADLENLEGEDPLILDRVSLTCFDETPLHIAAWRGHSDFTRALLSRKPRLASELNSARCSPLHLASAEGHHEIVQHLLDVNDDVCEVHDEDGRTPLHLAAMKGRVEVIELLTQSRPESICQKLGRGGETVLHLCVKYNRLEALKTLVDKLRIQNDAGFVNSKDQDGNTILHLAAALKQVDTVEYLLQVESVKEDPNAENNNGFTALDVVEDCPNRDLKQKEICKFLLQAGARRAQDLGTLVPESLTSEEIGTLPDSSQAILHPLPTPPTGEEIRTLPDNPQTQLTLWTSISCFWNKYFKADDGWFKEVRGHLITASTLTTTMAYQAGLSPPGSVWQDGPQGKNETTNDHSHIPGTSILASTDGTYATFVLFNTASLIASLSTLLLALSGFPPENKLLLFLLLSTMFCSITCMAFAYLLTLGMISPLESWDYVGSITSSSFIAWVGICTFVVVLHISRVVKWLWRKCNLLIQKRWPTRQPNNENNVNPMLRSNFFEWLCLKSRELVQKRWPTRRPNNEINVNL